MTNVSLDGYIEDEDCRFDFTPATPQDRQGTRHQTRRSHPRLNQPLITAPMSSDLERAMPVMCAVWSGYSAHPISRSVLEARVKSISS